MLYILLTIWTGCSNSIRPRLVTEDPWLAVKQGRLWVVKDGDTITLRKKPFSLFTAVLPSSAASEDWHLAVLYTVTNNSALDIFQPGVREDDLDQLLYNYMAPLGGYDYLGVAEKYTASLFYDPSDESGYYQRAFLKRLLPDGRLLLENKIESIFQMIDSYYFIPMEEQPYAEIYGCLYLDRDGDHIINEDELLRFTLRFL